MNMAKSTLGTRSGEIISVPVANLSVRCRDGSVIGPELYLGADRKLHVEPGSDPLTYSPEQLAIIQDKAWNLRRASLLDGIQELESSIRSCKRVLEPLTIVLDGKYAVIVEGHRRHIACTRLQASGFPIHTVPCIVYTAGYGEEGNYENLQYQMWLRNEKQPLTIFEKYCFIQDKLSSGMTKEAFCAKVGITQNEFDSIMVIAGQPENIRKLVENNVIAPSTLKAAQQAAKSKKWTQEQFETFITQTAELAQENNRRVSASVLEQALEQLPPPPEELPLIKKDGGEEKKPLVPRARIKPLPREIERLFYELMLVTEPSEQEKEVVLTLPVGFWNKVMTYWERVPETDIKKIKDKLPVY